VKRALVVLPAAIGLLLSACSSSGSGGDATLTVYAASSLTGAFTTIGKTFESEHSGTKVVFQFGSSGDLSTQITQGAPADVFASAAPKNMKVVTDAGKATSSVNFAANEAEIAVAPGNPLGIQTLADLAKPNVKVAICVATAPCGALANSILQKNNVTLTPTATPADVKSTLAVVESGDVDAAIVYVTDVKAAADKVTGVEIPEAQNQQTTYPIATLKDSKQSTLAQQFVSAVTSSAGQSVLKGAGFLPAS
jgi:molybdate transport system substrate-binding protein